MTDDATTPLSDREARDLALSAHLDGEAAPEWLAADPGAGRRLAELASVRDRLSVLPTVPDALLDAHIEAAMAGFDEAPGAVGGSVVPGPDRWRRFLPVVAAAAAVVAVVVFASSRPSDRTDIAAVPTAPSGGSTGSGGAEVGEFDATADRAAGTDDAVTESATVMAAPAPVYASLEALVDDVRLRHADTEAAPRDDLADDGSGCDAVAAVGATGVVAVEAAILDEDDVRIVVHDRDGARRVGVVRVADCTVLADQEL